MASGTSSEVAPSEMPVSEMGEATPIPQPRGFPPYPPYSTEPAPASVVDAVHAGRDITRKFKTKLKLPIRPPPKPARPKGLKVPAIKMSKRAQRAHIRCLRVHGAVLTDRLEMMSKPPKRNILYLWRERANHLPAETIARLRATLDADHPFKPDQAYNYFVNLRKTKKKSNKDNVNQLERDVLAVCHEKKFAWARNATIVFASGIQQRLLRPGSFTLKDRMLRMSNIILREICTLMQLRTPCSRHCKHPRARFMTEIADKIAIWIDDVIKDADDRMLMMDFDEDEDLLRADSAGGDAGFADDFLNMMSGGGLLKGPQSAYLKFTGDMLEAFMILTEAMYNKGNDQLLSHGKFTQTYKEAADELKQAPDFEATEFNCTLATQIKNDLTTTAKASTPSKLENVMKEIVDICSNYLAQHAEYNKEKGPAFKLLVKTMKTKPKEILLQKGKITRTYRDAAVELEQAKGLESDHDDPNLSQNIHSKLTNLMQNVTPSELKSDMTDTLDICSKYLSQRAIDEIERGPAFDLLIKELEKSGGDNFTPQFRHLHNKFAAAYSLKSAPGLTVNNPDQTTAPIFKTALHKAIDHITPRNLVTDMNEVVDRCGNYLSSFNRDRDQAIELLVKTMKSKPSKEAASRNNFQMNYGAGATEIESAPLLVPYLPVKDIADEIKTKLSADMQSVTPPGLTTAVKSVVQDASKHLSQPIAVKSGAAGDRYSPNLLAAVMNSIGSRPLFKYKSYGQTYHDGGEELKYAGPLEKDPNAQNLASEIKSELKNGIPTRLTPTLTADLGATISDASEHLAKTGTEKGNALDHLVSLMKKKGQEVLGVLQGYEQTYNDGSRRIENSKTLNNDKVDKGTYESVRSKLTKLNEEYPAPQYDKVMPGIVDDAAKYLSSPFPESPEDKRRVLADLMARKEDEIVTKEGIYKMTFTEGGEEIMKATVGKTQSHDNAKQKDILNKIQTVIPDKKLQDVLYTSAVEGAAHIADVVKGRGEAMQAIHDGLKKDGNKDFLSVGKFSKTHGQAADMLSEASHFSGQNPSPVLVDAVAERINAVPKQGVSPMAQTHMTDTANITAGYIAGVATKECGLDAKALEALQQQGGLTIKPGMGASGQVSGDEASGVRTDSTRAGDSDAGAAGAGANSTGIISSRPSSVGADGAGASADGAGASGAGVSGAGASGAGTSGASASGTGAIGAATGVVAGADEAERRRKAEEEFKRQSEEARRRSARASAGSGALGEFDPEKESALKILHSQLRSKGGETFYKQPQLTLSHAQASEWLAIKPPLKVEKTVKESGDTDRLHKKFEKKLSSIVSKCTPPNLADVMQDVVIESSRILSEYFVAKSYKTLVKDALLAEMQKRGNEILIEVNGVAESSFFAAQRLKAAKSYEVKEPCAQVAYKLTKRIEEITKCRTMARKLTATMKDHIKEAADYLSEHVTKEDEKIEAYVALIGEMEAAGDALLIEGNIPKSFKDSAAYLRQLTSREDTINRGNGSLKSSIESKLKNLMTNTTPTGYSMSALSAAISDSSKFLVSYIMLQEEKTKALSVLIEEMNKAGPAVLLRHGVIRKSYADSVEILRGKNSDQLSVQNADPVVSRKILLKLDGLMEKCPNKSYKALMDDVIEDVTGYLAVYLLQPQVLQVCKCMKNVFVQCELWCEEILRRISRPCCSCSRHVSAQAFADLVPDQQIHFAPGSTRADAPGIQIHVETCPSHSSRLGQPLDRSRSHICPAAKPMEGCRGNITSYMFYSTEYRPQIQQCPIKLSSSHSEVSSSTDAPTFSERSILCNQIFTENMHFGKNTSKEEENQETKVSTPCSFFTPPSTNTQQSTDTSCSSSNHLAVKENENAVDQFNLKFDSCESCLDNNKKIVSSQAKVGYNSRTPIVATDQMADWHAMMVSLMWNVRAWKDWIQEKVDRAVLYEPSRDVKHGIQCWATFQRKVVTEAYQWRQYNKFSSELRSRLSLRYKDKQIVSPTRATIKTHIYRECQQEMIEIISMFDKWTQWLAAVVKETDKIKPTSDDEVAINELRWSHFKTKIRGKAEDWHKCNLHLKYCWEKKYSMLISDWLPALKEPGPVWVVSAYGAVPSGAVAAGVFEGEVIWVARTTHNCNVLPAALHPSKHCCFVYADGAVHQYNKYQVICNAEVTWLAWRAGEVGARAVKVAPGLHIGRVQYRGSHLLGPVHAPNYRCHVVIFDRPFAFNCYELLVLSSDTMV